MKMDFSQADSGGGMSPEGAYLVRVADCDERTSKGGDNYFNVRLEGMEEQWAGKTVSYDILMCTGKGAGIGRAKLKALGITPEDGEELLPEVLVGRTATVHIMHEEYEGKARTKVNIEQGEHCGYDVDVDAGLPF